MKKFILMALLFVGVACRDITYSEPSSMEGTFVLTTINGRHLPSDTTPFILGAYSIDSGKMTFTHKGQTYIDILHYRIIQIDSFGSHVYAESDTIHGQYGVNVDNLELVPQGSSPYSMAITGPNTILSLYADGHTLIYIRK